MPSAKRKSCRAVSESRAVRTLDGRWQFRLDPGDVGRKQGWQHRARLTDCIHVPGAIQAQGFGGALPHSISQMGHPALQVERHAYLGSAWYMKPFDLPADGSGRRVHLHVGGVHPHAEFWLNGTALGRDPGGLLAFDFDITPHVREGRNRLAVRIFEGDRRRWDVAFNGGINSWGSRWSGIYRSVRLEATGPVWIDHVALFPSLKERRVQARILLKRARAAPRGAGSLRVSIFPPDGGSPRVVESEVSLSGRSAHVMPIPVPGRAAWTPETPELYRVAVELRIDGEPIDRWRGRFGLRDFSVRGERFLLNGVPIYLRGIGYNAIFPRTLSPDLDPAWIRKQIRTAKAYGFNAMVAYGVPYPEFLDVADEEGLLLQIFPGDLSGTALDRREHLERLLLQNINHACIMAYGWSAERYDNNPELDRNLDRLYAFSKAFDPTRLVVARDGGHVDNIGHGKSDFAELACCYRTTYDPRVLRRRVKQPVLLHEVGWFSSYPDPRVKRKYDGCAMRPYFITYAEAVARRQGVAGRLPEFVDCSQKLQALERRVVIEMIRKNPALSGFHLWMGNDMGSAVEGVWDDFGDPKNVAPEDFRRYNDATALLMEQDFRGRDTWIVPPDDVPETNPHDLCRDMQGRTLWEGERLRLDVRVSHFGGVKLPSAPLVWKLRDPRRARTLLSGTIRAGAVRAAGVTTIARLDVAMPATGRAARLVLEVEWRSGGRVLRNAWDFWAFPRDVLSGTEPGIYAYGHPGRKDYGMDWDCGSAWDGLGYRDRFPRLPSDARLVLASVPPDARLVLAYNHLSNGLIDYLAGGGQVLLMCERIFPEYPHRFRSIAWNSYPFGNSGTLVQDHPALTRFPHDGWGDLQFYDLARTVTARRLEDGGVINLDIWPRRIEPIIRSIDSYMGARRRGLLFEVAVGRGRLMVSRLNFVSTPAARFLFSELVRYLLAARRRPPPPVIPRAFLRRFVQWG